MTSDLNGTWQSEFKTSSGVNIFTLSLDFVGSEPTARMHLVRPSPDPVKGRTDFDFRVSVALRAGFLGLLAEDDADLGMNAMILKLSPDRSTLRGIIAFNNIRTNEVGEGTIEWRKCPAAKPQSR